MRHVSPHSDCARRFVLGEALTGKSVSDLEVAEVSVYKQFEVIKRCSMPESARCEKGETMFEMSWLTNLAIQKITLAGRRGHLACASGAALKNRQRHAALLICLGWIVALGFCQSADAEDARDIVTGLRIPDEGYCDQPYVVVTAEGHWLCTLTTGTGHEGQGGQHVVSTISQDHGKTWSPLVDIEPATGPAASWVVPLITPSGRVYAFYTFNGDNVDLGRNDVHGWYAMKYSDDGGRSWSRERHRLPLRPTACDKLKKDGQLVQMFWGIDKPKTADGTVYFAFTKLGRYFLNEGEGWLFTSDNLLTETDAREIHWDMRPEGQHGIRKDDLGSTQEEHNIVPLGGERLYCVYRTTRGYPCHAYSEDGGRTWSEIEPMTYTPGGRVVKTPRACPKLWRCANGKFLFWYHLHSGLSYQGRNPAWIIGGVQKDGRIQWSQPEILLYDVDPAVRMSYPDLFEDDDRYWVTETQKSIARIHEIDATLLAGTWNQLENRLPREVITEGCVADLDAGELATDDAAMIEAPLTLEGDGGVTVELCLTIDRFTPDQVLLDTRNASGVGWAISEGADKTLTLSFCDGEHRASWTSDAGLLKESKQHHVAFVVDGGPHIISVIVDGVLCDGGDSRQFGWGRFDSAMSEISGTGEIRADLTNVRIDRLRIYDRYLRTAEVVQNYVAEN